MKPGPWRTRLAVVDAVAWPALIGGYMLESMHTSHASGNMGSTLLMLVFVWGLAKLQRALGREACPRPYKFTTWLVARVLMAMGVFVLGIKVTTGS